MVHSFLVSFIAIFVALDVIGTLPMFVSMTHGLSRTKRNVIIDKSMAVAVTVALLFTFVGQKVFTFFGITFYDFKMAGGLVLLLVSLADLVGGPEAISRGSGSTGVVPLAVPLITGPAVLTAVVLQVEIIGYLIPTLALLVNYLLAWVIFKKSEKVTGLIGKDGTMILSKIAALLLATIAVSMIRSGIIDTLRHLPTV